MKVEKTAVCVESVGRGTLRCGRRQSTGCAIAAESEIALVLRRGSIRKLDKEGDKVEAGYCRTKINNMLLLKNVQKKNLVN